MTIWDCASWTRPTLQLPSDYQAFTRALELYGPGSPDEKEALDAGLPAVRFNIAVSDKGRDLLGVFQFFRSLPEALVFLTNDFLRDVIRRLSPEEPANNKKHIRELTSKLREIIQQGRQETSDVEHLVKRVLSLAARSFASQGEQLKSAGFEKLLTWAKGNRQDRGREIEKQLTESVTYLRDRGFLWQGFGWRCAFCQHHNWVPLEQLVPITQCEICRKSKSSPVSSSLHFRLNPFVHHAFASTSAQEPVIWCLNRLARRARWSFAFAPTLDVYRPGNKDPETDLDLLVAVDGQVYVVEVKSSFAGVELQVLKQLKGLAAELRPDVIMLAVMAHESDPPESVKMIRAFELGITDVRLELLTLDGVDRSPSHDKIARPLSKHMNWSAGSTSIL